MDEHDITGVIHLAALQVPFVREDPVARRERERDRHGQRARGGAAPRRRHGARRLRVVDRRAARRTPAVPEHALRRLQARQRGHRAPLLRRLRRLVGRPAPAHGLRPRPRPGPDLGADRRDGRRREGRGVHDPVRRRAAVPVRRRRGRGVRARERGRRARAPRCTTSTARSRASRRSSRRSRRAAPEAAGRITSEGTRCRSRRRSTRRRSRSSSAARPRRPFADGVAEAIAAFR